MKKGQSLKAKKKRKEMPSPFHLIRNPKENLERKTMKPL